MGDTRGTTFGSQSASVLAVDQEKGHFIYLGDRWDSGKADSTYVWLPLTIGENGTIEMHNPAQEGEPDGWDLNYWDNHGSAKGKLVNWTVETGDDLPKTVNTGGTVTLPDTVNVKEGDDTIATKVTWNVEGGTAVSKSTKAAGSTYAFNVPGTYTITGTLARAVTSIRAVHSVEPSMFPAPTRFPEVGRKLIGRAAARARFLRPAVLMTSRLRTTPIVASGRIATRAVRCTS
mgnify:FL=1